MTAASLRREGGRWQTDRQAIQVQACDLDLGAGESLRLIQIPAGEFWMGSPATEPEGSDQEGPQHRVRLAGFLLGQGPVTHEQWRLVVDWPKLDVDLRPKPFVIQDSRVPVSQVQWRQAMEFCRRLSLRSGHFFSLPSEAQWEYACRAGTTTPFAFGETISLELANYDWNYSYATGAGPEEGKSRSQRTSAASFPANAWGLHDMHGNVQEWCLDHWHTRYESAPTDGSAWLDGESLKPENNNTTIRVMRGGSWFHSPKCCRSAARSYCDTNILNHYYVGFPLVCLPQAPSLIP
ncbi:MAG: hypothetical protein RLZZ117_2320 [Cyanobacteriota bacterium]